MVVAAHTFSLRLLCTHLRSRQRLPLWAAHCIFRKAATHVGERGRSREVSQTMFNPEGVRLGLADQERRSRTSSSFSSRGASSRAHSSSRA
jgi:hypothetical protein